MDLGIHLPLMEFGEEGQSLERVASAVDAARECGFTTVCANDHFLFATPWLDGLTALAAVVERSGELTLATTIALAVLRGPVPLAKALAALDVISDGRLVAGVGPGSSSTDYEAVGIPFEQRWPRFEECVAVLRTLLRGDPPPSRLRWHAVPDERPAPAPRGREGVPIWIGSWGSEAGMRRVARLADGWLASAYNTTPQGFAAARELLARELRASGRDDEGFPNGLSTMWTWITEDRSEANRVLTGTLAPLLNRDPERLRGQLCVGGAHECAELLSRFADAGCERVHLWPLGDEPRQIELAAGEVMPRMEG